MSDKDEDIKRLKDACSVLSEHFDAVQIFVTRYEGVDEGTTAVKFGAGNYYARFGQIKEWVVKEEEDARIELRDQ